MAGISFVAYISLKRGLQLGERKTANKAGVIVQGFSCRTIPLCLVIS